MVSFTQLIATAIATAAYVAAAPTAAAPVTTETAPLILVAGGAIAPGAITDAGAYSFTVAAGTFTVERDPSKLPPTDLV
jgi:hypothetical protein